MALTKNKKKIIIDKITAIVKESPSLVLINITGIKNNDLVKLKSFMHQANTNIKVIKKTLLNIALKNSGFDNIPLENFKFGCALIPCKNDPIKVIKVLASFTRDVLKKNLQDILAGGFIDKYYVDKTTLAQYAYLPSIEELYVKLVSSLTYPIRTLAMNLKFLSGLKLTYLLKILAQTKT